MTFEEEYPNFNKFLRLEVYLDIKEDFEITYRSSRKEGKELVLTFKDGKKQYTPIKELDGWLLRYCPPTSSIYLSCSTPYEAEEQLKKLAKDTP